MGSSWHSVPGTTQLRTRVSSREVRPDSFAPVLDWLQLYVHTPVSIVNVPLETRVSVPVNSLPAIRQKWSFSQPRADPLASFQWSDDEIVIFWEPKSPEPDLVTGRL